MAGDRKDRPESVARLFGVSLGDVAAAAFVLCALSGAFLAVAFDTRDAAGVIAGWLLANSGAVFVRNVHYWTAQLFLVCTVLHAWEHIRLGTERRVGRGVWLRMVLALPALVFVMLSGFLLRGDADARQALRIVREIAGAVPLVGTRLGTFLFGAGEQLQVVYAHHAATATIVVWLVIVEHARRLWPRAGGVAAVGVSTAAVSLVLSPGLHDGMDPLLKGPWYFLGLQEVLHWLQGPWPVVWGAVAGLVVLWAVPRLSGAWRTWTLRLLLTVLAGYAALTAVGLFFRGENWRWEPGWPRGRGDLQPGFILGTEPGDLDAGLRGGEAGGAQASPRADPGRASRPSGAGGSVVAVLPMVLGRPEGCLVCHAGVTGLGAAHRPEAIGCASCHGGNVFTLAKERAHAGMVRIPGNRADAARTCGQAACHPTLPGRMERSIMNTFAGAIAVNRRTFGEAGGGEGGSPPSISTLGHSPADSHFRQLCASCHLGLPKEAWGPIGETSRGGGCNACHLTYDAAALKELGAYQEASFGGRRVPPRNHPDLNARADDRRCFGCHSRSSRISTNYEGWHELNEAPQEVQAELPSKAAGGGPAMRTAAKTAAESQTAAFRQLEDGRWFRMVPPDVHHERGLACVDCHTAQEVMGAGHVVRDKLEQVRVRCEDCHAANLAAVAPAAVDPESRRLLALRGTRIPEGLRFGRTRDGDALIHVRVDQNGRGRLVGKVTGREVDLRPPARACSGDRAHARLACATCHTAWAPRCASCHTTFEPQAEGFDHLTQEATRGAWRERAGPFEATPPTLGVRRDLRDAGRPDGTIETYVPGMILRLDKNPSAAGAPDRSFHRLYARLSTHTIRREVRRCESCHADPVALGFGSGRLRFVLEQGRGRWLFEPAQGSAPEDGLPEDAWVGFGQTRPGGASTRDDARPFTREEQQRILRVGACLTCHAGESAAMGRALDDFDAAWRARGAHCMAPDWD